VQFLRGLANSTSLSQARGATASSMMGRRAVGQARPGQHRVCAGGLALCGLAVGSSAVKRVSDIWPYENS
jgi:hypothetical protein